MGRRGGGPNVWPVVADFFLALLAVVIVLVAKRDRPDPRLEAALRRIDARIQPLILSKMVKEARVEYPETRIVLAEDYLAFPECGWTILPARLEEVRSILDLFLPVDSFVVALNIEGHADTRRPTLCKSLTFGTNFELSQRRALAVYAGLLRVEITQVEDTAAVFDANRNEPGIVWRLKRRNRVLVAGYGDSKPWPGASSPTDLLNRRVELRLLFCRRRNDAACSRE
jgi:outer membrane protein OmpA-like peptidoglycan-associated protein